MSTSKAVVLAVVVLSLASCSGDEGDLRAVDAVGLPISRVEPHIPDGATFTVVDLSEEVGQEPSYTDNARTSDRWVIVAACADTDLLDDAKVVQLAVVPAGTVEELTEDSEQARAVSSSVDCGS